MSRRTALLVVTAAAALPRVAVALIERGQLIEGLTEKSDRFANVLVASGTFGFIPGRPSAFTQPLYAFVLAPLYETAGRNWVSISLLQTLIATGTALLVFAIGERVVSRSAGVIAAVLATVHPYLVWHDLHLNREIVDGFLAALVTYLVVVTVERNSVRLAWCTGAACGLAILGNARLALLPLALAGYLVVLMAPRRTALIAIVGMFAAAVLVIAPWVVRNKVSVGCVALTTDSRALWKANNLNTRAILAHGGWIDQVPEVPGAPPWPELAADTTLRTGHVVEADECAQMRYYRGLVTNFWRDHPGEKGRLAIQAVTMLWTPKVTVDESGPSSGFAGVAKDRIEPVYFLVVVALALVGVTRLRRSFLALVLLLLGYQTLMAMVFAGTLRYRAPWDFLLCIPAAIGILRIASFIGSRRTERTAA